MIAKPEKQIVPPASACVYRSNLPNLANPIPHEDRSTIANIVVNVVNVNTVTTRSIPEKLLLAAGYINNGIKGSHGPRTKIVNNTHGVRSLALDFLSCT